MVDEAQDLSPMQLLSIARRSRNGWMTVLGDLAQATSPAALGSWNEVADHLYRPDVPADLAELRLGYRLPTEVHEVAMRLLREISPGLATPEAVLVAHKDHDQEVKRIVEEGYRRAYTILEVHRDALVRVAEGLLEFETLDGEEIEACIKGVSLDGKKPTAADIDSEGRPVKEKVPGTQPSLPQLINPKGKPAPA